jgi:hypothetical protein
MSIEYCFSFCLLGKLQPHAAQQPAGSIARNFWEPRPGPGPGPGRVLVPGAWWAAARGSSCILSILERRQIDRLCSSFAAETDREGWTAAGGRLPFLARPLIPAGGFHMRFNRCGVVWRWYAPARGYSPCSW